MLVRLAVISTIFGIGIIIGMKTSPELGILGWLLGGFASLISCCLMHSLCSESYCGSWRGKIVGSWLQRETRRKVSKLHTLSALRKNHKYHKRMNQKLKEVKVPIQSLAAIQHYRGINCLPSLAELWLKLHYKWSLSSWQKRFHLRLLLATRKCK